MGLGEGRPASTLIQSPQPPVTLQYWSTVLVFINHSCPRKGPKLVRRGRRPTLHAHAASSDLCSRPCPWPAATGPWETDRYTCLRARTRAHTHTHTHTERQLHLPPPSALLKPIVQTMGGAPKKGGALPHLGLPITPPAPCSAPLHLWVFTSSACDPHGRREARKQSKGACLPSAQDRGKLQVKSGQLRPWASPRSAPFKC